MGDLNEQLFDALWANDLGAVTEALDGGADPSALHDDELPIVAAARGCDQDVVDALLARGADVNGANEQGRQTALTVACQRGDLGLVQLLLARGADAAHIGEGFTALTAAAFDKGKTRGAIVRALLAKGADARHVLRSNAGVEVASVLMRCAATGSAEIVELLIQAGAPVNGVYLFGTALTAAAAEGNAETAAVLVQHGADRGARVPDDPRSGEHRGKSALEIATRKKSKKLLALLGS